MIEKAIILNQNEVESLKGIIAVEISDLQSIAPKYKKGSPDRTDIDNEIETLNSVMQKLSK